MKNLNKDLSILSSENSKIEYFIITDLFKYNSPKKISIKDKIILRNLALKLKEITSSAENIEKRKLWVMHNSLEKTRPLVLVFPEDSWYELLPKDSLQISAPFLREYEWYLRSLIYRHENIKDDYVYEPYINVQLCFSDNQFGLPIKTHKIDTVVSFIKQIEGEKDLKKLLPIKFVFDEESTNKNYHLLSEIFDEIIDVKISKMNPTFIDTSFLTRLIAWRGGLEQVCFDMIEKPKLIHLIMEYMTSKTQEILEYLEKQNLFSLNNDNSYINSGGIGCSKELPKSGYDNNVRLKDLWGSSQGQDFTGVSPEMFYEFALQYQIKILKNFGLNSYGCCEDISKKIKYIKKIPNLRRVSVSPFTNMEIAAEELTNKYVYVWKPNPSYVSMDSFDDDFIKKDLKKGFETAKNCVLEVILKDLLTVKKDPSRIFKWTKIALELAKEN